MNSIYIKTGSIILMLITLRFYGCTEVFEVRLDEATVTIIIPQDSLRTPVATQTFWWEDVYGADQYRIQIVSPSFDSIYSLISDEFIDTSKYTYTLNPGTYQWRVKALNSATESPWAVHTLIIDSTLDLSTQNLVLLTPKQNDTSNSLTHTLSWQNLYNADEYRYEIWQPDVTGVQVGSGTTTNASITATLAAEGTFTWRVRAENALGNTPYSTRVGYADTTAPALSVPQTPANGSIFLAPVIAFNWFRSSDNGSSVRDSLVLATDSNFVQVYNTYVTRATSVTDSVASGVYYWRLYTRDKAGNKTGPSTTRNFTVQ